MTLALKLTWLRIALILPCLLLLLFPIRFHALWALLLFVIASLTDFFDGHIARRTQTTTSLGAFLDPIADKLLVLLVFIVLQAWGAYPLWLLLAVVARELINDSFRSFAATKNVILSANHWGKWKAMLQMASLALAMLSLAAYEEQFEITGILQILAVLLMIGSLILGVIGSYVFIKNNRSLLA